MAACVGSGVFNKRFDPSNVVVCIGTRPQAAPHSGLGSALCYCAMQWTGKHLIVWAAACCMNRRVWDLSCMACRQTKPGWHAQCILLGRWWGVFSSWAAVQVAIPHEVPRYWPVLRPDAADACVPYMYVQPGHQLVSLAFEHWC
jgi:hypothetical protein